MNKLEDCFPQGIAAGRAFLDRKQDLEWLMRNIESGHHTLLLAPRRYGKTSLVKHCLALLKLPYADTDFYLSVTQKAVEKKLIKSIQEVIGQVITKPEKIYNAVQSYFKRTKKKWSFGFKGIAGLELEPDPSEDSAENILTVLGLLDDILQKKNMRAVLFIDEVQELQTIENGRAIAGAIRHFAQQPNKKISFIFSGSNRKMLSEMFDSYSAPLYELCDKIILDRLEKDVYHGYFNKIAKHTWGQNLDESTIREMLTITECHPKRTYNLAYHLWRMNESKKNLPKPKDVITAWESLLSKHLKYARYDLSHLNPSQLKVLTLIALGTKKGLTGQAALRKLNLSGAATTKALAALEEHDCIEKNQENEFRVIDPLIRDILAYHDNENLE